MKQNIRLYLIFFVFFASGQAVFAQNTVVIKVLAANQKTDFGYNIVSELARLVYPKLISGQLKLYPDANQMQRLRSKVAITNMERLSGTTFENATGFYIYELWNFSGKNTSCEIKGFQFFQDDTSLINYGFINATDLKKELLTTKVFTNADGPGELSFEQALSNFVFNYEIIDFGGKKVRMDSKQNRIKNIFFTKNNYIPTVPFLRNQKYVTYEIYPWNPNNYTSGNNIVHLALNAYANDMKEDFLNSGGTYHSTDYSKNERISLKKLVVTEQWFKLNDSIGQVPLYLSLEFSNGSKVDNLPLSSTNDWALDLNGESLSDFLVNKQFGFKITQINNQKITTREAKAYYSALQTWNWKDLNGYQEAMLKLQNLEP